jgi:hypothetical protein
MKKKILIFIAALSYQILSISYKASACPLCQAGATKQTQAAYLGTTILLMSIPMVSLGLLIFWLRGKYGKSE